MSGPGSSLEATRRLRAAFPGLIERYGIRSVLDVPCGDLNWIRECLPKGIQYEGGDLVPELVERNLALYPALGSFKVMDLVRDPLPSVDLILVRDCFIHLPVAHIKWALANIERSGSKYLLTTSYTSEVQNIDIEIGGFRRIDLTQTPFGWPPAVEYLVEDEPGKGLGLWRVADLKGVSG